MLIILDLDNTLYNWVEYHAHVTRFLINEISNYTACSSEAVVSQLRLTNQRVGNSERLEVIAELPCVLDTVTKKGPLGVQEIVKRVLAEQRKALHSYPNVASTLQTLRLDKSSRIVAHTEAMADTALHRLKMLSLWNYFDRMYAIDHRGLKFDAPFVGQPEEEATFEAGNGRLSYVPVSERKPNPLLLKDICAREGIPAENAIYMGDSLVRDVSMANEAGVFSVWARYGTSFQPSDWQTLVSITHWTPEDVERDNQLRRDHLGVKPNAIADRFEEILDVTSLQMQQRQLS